MSPQRICLSEVFKQLEENDPLLKHNPRCWPMFPVQHPGSGTLSLFRGRMCLILQIKYRGSHG